MSIQGAHSTPCSTQCARHSHVLTILSFLQYWRNECVVYQRANKSPKSSAEAAQNSRGSKILAKSAVPEICDVIIRSPEATPWRRKYPKKAGHDDTEQGTSSVDSKSATVKKKARSQKKKVVAVSPPCFASMHDRCTSAPLIDAPQHR